MSRRVKDKEFVVYKISNTVNGKIYIGLTGNFKERVCGHKCAAKNKSYNFPLYNAMNKHGIENFEFNIIEEYDTEQEMRDGEIKWISFYNSVDMKLGYNLRGGGELPYHTGEMVKSQQESCYIANKRRSGGKHSKYKCVSAGNKGYGFIALISVYGKRIHLGNHRTEIEAAWAYDEAVRGHLSPDLEVYLNFPNGKTRELIFEQLLTKNLIEKITHSHFNIKFRNKDSYYMVRGMDLKTRKHLMISCNKDVVVCEKELSEYIYKYKSINSAQNCTTRKQKEYELLHGYASDLVTPEELISACMTGVGRFY